MSGVQAPASQPRILPETMAIAEQAFKLTVQQMMDSVNHPDGPQLPKLANPASRCSSASNATMAAHTNGTATVNGSAQESHATSGGEAASKQLPAVLHVNALDLLRCCTFRVVVTVVLGLPLDFLDLAATLEVVHKVTHYFKVRRQR